VSAGKSGNKSLASATPNKHRKAKKCNKTKQHIGNYKMNTQSQNTKTKWQHQYASQKQQYAQYEAPKSTSPQSNKNLHTKKFKKAQKNKANTRRKEEVAVQG
jgi:hypothetical protein